MTDKVILPLMDGRWLALSPETFQKGLQQGHELMPEEQNAPANGEQWLTVPEAAERTRVSKSYWYEAIRVGDCPSRKFGTAVRIPASFLAHVEA